MSDPAPLGIMTGAEHATEASRLLAAARFTRAAKVVHPDNFRAELVARAAVHAQLADVAATIAVHDAGFGIERPYHRLATYSAELVGDGDSEEEVAIPTSPWAMAFSPVRRS